MYDGSLRALDLAPDERAQGCSVEREATASRRLRYLAECVLLALIMKARTSRIVCWILEDQTGFVTADRGEDEVLIVFRASKEARRFQERTTTENFKLVGMSPKALQALLERYDVGWVG